MARIFAALGLMTIAVVARLVPHIPNATAINASSIAAARYLGRTWAIVIPIASMLIADLVIGWYDWRILLFVYGSIACTGILAIARRHVAGTPALALTAAGSSLIFFLVTNAAVWMFSPWYEKTFAGLVYAYELGLPFLRWMLIGDLVYTFVIVGVIELVPLLCARGRRSHVAA